MCVQNCKRIDLCQQMTDHNPIPLSHNSVQSHNSVFSLCLTSLIKDSGSLHSTLVVKSELRGKNRFLNETYLINYQNINFSPIQMQHCFFDHTSSKFIQKCYLVVGVWSCQQSHLTISELCRSTVDAQCDCSRLCNTSKLK